jgi:phage-related protein
MRQTLVFGNHFWEFYNACNPKLQKRIDWVIGLVRSLKMVPTEYLKHLEGTNGLYEIRVSSGSNIYRIFCFFDEGNLIILLHGFQKKTQKTPTNQIKLAKKLIKDYYEYKTKT